MIIYSVKTIDIAKQCMLILIEFKQTKNSNKCNINEFNFTKMACTRIRVYYIIQSDEDATNWPITKVMANKYF